MNAQDGGVHMNRTSAADLAARHGMSAEAQNTASEGLVVAFFLILRTGEILALFFV